MCHPKRSSQVVILVLALLAGCVENTQEYYSSENLSYNLTKMIEIQSKITPTLLVNNTLANYTQVNIEIGTTENAPILEEINALKKIKEKITARKVQGELLCENISYRPYEIIRSNKVALRYARGFYTFTQPSQNKEFLLVRFEVRNLGEEPEYYSFFSSTIYGNYTKFEEFRPSFGIYTEEYSPVMSTKEEEEKVLCEYGKPWKIAPGEEVRICEVFEVPSGFIPTIIELRGECTANITLENLSVIKIRISETSKREESEQLVSEEEFPEEVFVLDVIDGDTFTTLEGEKVRLLGINSPELGQRCYEEAKKYLETLILGKKVRLEKEAGENKDIYGRLLRYVFTKDGIFVNEKIVREGYAKTYLLSKAQKYADILSEAQDYAIENKAGCLWREESETMEGEDCNKCIGIAYFHYNAAGNDCENLNDEYVIFKNTCDFECNLTRWRVEDERGHTYVFPQFVLQPFATVTLYTGCGENTEKELYWCHSGHTCNAVWNNDGDTLYLYNSEGLLVIKYNYSK